MMKVISVILMFLMSITFSFAYDYNSNNNYSNNDYNNQNNTQNSNNSSSNNNNSNNQLMQEMNKKTTKGLKVFDKLLKDDGQSKQDFFADVGQDPTSDQFEGGGGDGTPVKNTFKGILNDSNDQGS